MNTLTMKSTCDGAYNDLALGRNHMYADSLQITHFSTAHRVEIMWNDGAKIWAIYDTKAEAHSHAERLGFYLKK